MLRINERQLPMNCSVNPQALQEDALLEVLRGGGKVKPSTKSKEKQDQG